uniref:Band 7 domain-containing protein n=1 Tax=Panagrolaimus sp. JU765 TaxID=591449 RepID=A0AC34PZM2_9BILA
MTDRMTQVMPGPSEQVSSPMMNVAQQGIKSTDDRPSEQVSSPMMNVAQQGIKSTDDRATVNEANFGFCSYFLIGLSYFLTVLFFPIALCTNLKIVQEYERAVIFRLGRILPGGAKGPGLFFILPCIDTYRKIDLRVVSFSVPPQEILTKDSVTAEVDAVVYYRVKNATMAVNNVENAESSTRLLAQTTLRNILGTKTLAELLSQRESTSHEVQAVLDDTTEEWGVKVERVEVKDVRIPPTMQRSMAAIAEAEREAKAKVIAAEGEQQASKALSEAAKIIQGQPAAMQLPIAEAEREAKAKVIAAEGEQQASKALSEAAKIIQGQPAAMQLRYLQTLNTISAEHNSTIVFPFPIDLMHTFMSVVHPDHQRKRDAESDPELGVASSSHHATHY